MAAAWSTAPAATDDFSKVTKATQVFKADDFLGAGNTAISIGVPPGRKNMQPEINTSYSSAAPNGWLGVGWTLNLGYIERSTKNGIPKYTSSDTFYLSFQGLNTDLVSASYYNPNEYYPKTSPVIIKFLFNGTFWTAYDKEGRTYIFGETSNSRIDLPQGTFRWALSKVVDSCGNYMTITYTQDNYQIYPLRIEYAGNEAAAVLPTHKVEFTLESRQDVISSYRSGYNIITTKRLREIKTYVSNSLASRYLFEYVYSGQTNRSLLNKFTRFGSDGVTSLPSSVFTYNNSPPGSYRFINVADNQNNKLWNIRRNFGSLPSTFTEEILPPKGMSSTGMPMVLWDHVKTEQTGSFWSVDSKAKLSVNLPDAGAFHAWTYVYVSAAKTISISATGNQRFFFWLNGDYTVPANPQSINLKEGSNLIEITGYNKTGLCTFNLNYALSDNVTRVNSFQYAIPQFVGDFNGDGMSDLGVYYGSIGSIRIALSLGETFGSNDIWPVLPFTVFPGMLPQANSIFLGDFNGDTLTDLIAMNAVTEIEPATASKNKNFTGGGYYGRVFNVQGKPFMADFNNDGKADLGLQADSTNDILIALKGATSSFNTATSWLYNFPGKILIGDFNGDGLMDIGSLNTSQSRVNIALSKGGGFLAPSAWLSSITVSDASTADLNNDGLTDLVYYDKVNGRIMAAFSDGTKFLAPVVYLSGFSLKNVDVFIQSGDFNGDCAVDFYVFDPVTLKSDLAYSGPYFADMLNKVENGRGGFTSIDYGISAKYLNTGLPFLLPVVNKVTISDGMGNSFATAYSFKDGLYDKTDREFRGFGTVGMIDSDGNKRIVYLKQDSIFKGRVYREEHRDAADKLYLKIENTWASQLMKDWSMGAGNLVVLKRQDKYTYDGDATYKTSYAIDEFSPAYGATSGTYSNQVGGDVTMITEGGTSTVQKYNYMKYAWTNGDPVLTRPSFVASLATDTALTLNKKQLYYDNNTAIDAKSTKGLLTKEKVFTAVKNNSITPETIDTYALITSYAYDTFGNLISKTDPESRTTTITYDTAYRIFPIQENNAAGLIVKRTYDVKTGEVLTYTDENNQVTTYVYDTFGRLTKVIGPNDTAQYPGTTYEYDVTACPNKVTKRQKTVSPSTYTTEISFYDGLGRLIETKVDAEPDPSGGQARQIVKDVVTFNAQGKAKEKYNPYFVAASNAGYSAPGAEVGKTAMEYDCVGRVTQITNPDFTYRTIQYSDWVETKTNENGAQVSSTYDAYNRLIQKDEFNQGQTYTTKYQYDLSYYDASDYLYKKEFRITDTKNNVTSIICDLADRKIKMTDPDMGIWNYYYDRVGNLKSQKDGKGQVFSFSYDQLNRLTAKSYPDAKVIVYFYDDPGKTFCKGRLSYISDLIGRKDFYYDNLGRQIKVTQVIDGVSYPIERTYNAAGQVTSLKYPDGEIVNYTYNQANAIDKIIGSSTYVNNVDYAPTGQMQKVNYGNGAYTDYTYDARNFRLTDVRTNNGGLQNLNYIYDSAGNISYIRDYKNSATQNFAYDNLNRLISANGAYGNMAYQYDSIGNMISKEGVSLGYGQGGSKPHAVTSSSDGFSATYDANGNMISKNGSTLTYNYDNRLIKYERAGSGNSVTVDIPLTSGWNFISLPVTVTNSAITSALSSISGQYDQVSRYNPATLKYENFVNDLTFNQFTTMELGRGYQIYVTNPSGCTLRITGTTLAANTNISLVAGWQLFGYPSHTPKKVSDALTGLVKGTHYDRICRYNKATQAYVDLAPTDSLVAGESYFLHMLTPSTLVATPTLTSELAEFVYDADGSRVKKTYNGVATIYVGELYEKTGSLITKHIYLGANRIASKTSTDTLYYHSDHMGSSNVITNASGAQVQLSEYKPFGELSLNTASKVNYYFTGKELDPTGLYYYGARYYDPRVGRFITADNYVAKPFNPQYLNRYSYCMNNPLRYIDPTGNYPLDSLTNPITSYITTNIDLTFQIISVISTNIISLPTNFFTSIDFGIRAIGNGIAFFVEQNQKKNDKIDRWWSTSFEVLLPGYGNYGGPFRTDPTFTVKPVDSMDILFQAHDLGWSVNQGKEADRKLLQGLYGLPSSSREWSEPASNAFWTTIYRRVMAEPLFWWIEFFRKEE